MCRYMLLCAVVGLTLVAEAVISHAAPEKDAKAEKVAALIRQLGDARFARREAASKELAGFGEEILNALREAAATSPDLEVRRRAARVIAAITPSSRRSKSLDLEMVLIDAGEFSMGSRNVGFVGRPDEDQHRVRLTKPFYLGAHEVTQGEYRKVMKANPSWFSRGGGGKDKVAGRDTDVFPVEQTTWFDAVEFCNRLSKEDGFESYYAVSEVERDGDSITSAKVAAAGGRGYRLPTEAEWEYACRAGTTTLYNFGDETRAGLINCKPLSVASGYGSSLKWPDLGRTSPVGSSPPNRWGLYDMHGNAGEWCWDRYDRGYYRNSPVNDPRGPATGTHRVMRGGSWLVTEGSCRSGARFFHAPDEKKYYGGFRLARAP